MSDVVDATHPHARRSKLRQKISDFLDSRFALPLLAFIGFLENSIIIFAMEPLFLPAMASRGRGAWRVAAALLVGNIIAGVAMYALGMWAAEAFLDDLLKNFGALGVYRDVTSQLQDDGFWALFMVGITPMPFQFGAAAAGAVGYSFPFFLLAVTISRAIRYFAEAGLIMALGKRGEEWLECHELEIFLIGIGIFVGMILVYFFM